MAAAGWVAECAAWVAATLAARPAQGSAMVAMSSLPRWSTGFIDLVLSVLFRWAPASCGPLSCSGCWAQPGGRAQGTAHALPGWGCPGRGVQPPGQALAAGLGQHLPLPLPGELRAGAGVHEHGLLLPARVLGCLAC